MTWLSDAVPFVGGGAMGAALTYVLTWAREHSAQPRLLQTPQRQAIGEIVAATHELMLRELESRTAFTELIQQIRRNQMPTGQLMATAAGMG